jgi:nucleotide-binding universal stress UspA family protein
VPIVVGFIPTPEGQAALTRAASEAQLRQTTLLVVASHDPTQEGSREAVARFEAELEQVAVRLSDAGLAHEVRRLDRGRLPSEDLLDVADEVDADLVVIGLRRRSAVGKLILGSQAQRILLDAERPVLAVKAPA